jgi:hypothetical protein
MQANGLQIRRSSGTLSDDWSCLAGVPVRSLKSKMRTASDNHGGFCGFDEEKDQPWMKIVSAEPPRISAAS